MIHRLCGFWSFQPQWTENEVSTRTIKSESASRIIFQLSQQSLEKTALMLPSAPKLNILLFIYVDKKRNSKKYENRNMGGVCEACDVLKRNKKLLVLAKSFNFDNLYQFALYILQDLTNNLAPLKQQKPPPNITRKVSLLLLVFVSFLSFFWFCFAYFQGL